MLLLLSGAILGIATDRLWLSPRSIEGMSLTADAMAARLGLSAEEEERLSILLDSLHVEIAAAIPHGPDSLRAATAAAHLRIEASLPEPARPAFHGWMQEHHEHMRHRMHLGPMAPGMMRGGGAMDGTGMDRPGMDGPGASMDLPETR